jgi:hypothetical protein
MRKDLIFFGNGMNEYDFLKEKGFSSEEIKIINPDWFLRRLKESSYDDNLEEVILDYLSRDFYFSSTFGRIDLSGQGSYRDQHREWFLRADTAFEVKYLRGRKAFLADDLLILGREENSVVISVQAFLECLVDDRGIYERVFSYQGDHDLRMKVIKEFLNWHFEKVHWGWRDAA